MMISMSSQQVLVCRPLSWPTIWIPYLAQPMKERLDVHICDNGS